MNQYNMGYHLKEGFHSIFTHGLMSFAAVCMIVACLIIMGSFSLVAVNLDNTLGDLEAENEFTAYVEEGMAEADAQALQTELEQIPNVSSVTFVNGEQALEDYRQRYVDSENAALFEDLPEDLLQHRFRIHVVDIESLSQTVAAVAEVDGISETQAALDIAQGFITIRNMAGAVAWILILLLLIISLFIIANTIKLATFHRRDRHHEDVRGHQLVCPLALYFRGHDPGLCGCHCGLLPPVGYLQPDGHGYFGVRRASAHRRRALPDAGAPGGGHLCRRGTAHRRGGQSAGHPQVPAGLTQRVPGKE